MSEPVFPSGSAPNSYDIEQNKNKHCYAVRSRQRTQVQLSQEGDQLTNTQYVSQQSNPRSGPEIKTSGSENNDGNVNELAPLGVSEMNTLITPTYVYDFHNADTHTASREMINAAVTTHEINSTNAMIPPECLQIHEQNICFETVGLQVGDYREEMKTISQAENFYDGNDTRISDITPMKPKTSQVRTQRIRSSSSNIFQNDKVRFKLGYLTIFFNILVMIFNMTANFCKARINIPFVSASSNGRLLRCSYLTQSKDREGNETASPCENSLVVETPDWLKPNDKFIALLEHNSFSLTQAANNTSVIGKISDQTVTLLIDTGANVTAIQADVWRRIPALVKYTPTPTPIHTIKAVSGAEIPVLGQLEVPFEIDKHVYTFKALVIECLTYEAILGRDFLEFYNAKIDLGKQLLH